MNQITNQILNVFDGFRMPPVPNDEYENKGKALLSAKINSFAVNNQPIDFVLLGFPFKSPNHRDKTLGKLPDKAEAATMQNFASFNENVKQVYPMGVNIHIVSDGYIFNDLLEESDAVVSAYKLASLAMRENAPVQMYDLHDFYKGDFLSSKREQLMNDFGISEEKLQQEIMFNPDVNYLYRGMIHFMEEELAVRQFPSRNQLQKAAKALTRKMMLRNEAYSNFVRQEFSSMIRLSMHPSVNSGAKYSFQLIPSPKAKHSAWHSALLINADGSLETIHRKDAETQGFELVHENGQPYYFINKKQFA